MSIFRKPSSWEAIPLAALLCCIFMLGGLELFPMVTERNQNQAGQSPSDSGILLRRWLSVHTPTCSQTQLPSPSG